MRRLWVCGLLVLSGAGVGAVEFLLPDLVPWAKKSAYLYDAQVTGTGADRRLYFSGVTANVGRGPFETNEGPEPGVAYQRVYDAAGGHADRPSGRYAEDHADPDPDHSDVPHYERFALYFLRAVRPDGSVGPVVAASPKSDYSTFDNVRYDGAIPGAPSREVYYRGDGFHGRLGISAGWADVYARTHPLQYIPLSSVPDGDYWLEMVVDPDRSILESDKSNNTARLRLRLAGAGVTFHEETAPPPPPPPPAGALLSETFSRPDGLVTNEYAYYNPSDPSAVKSEVWDVTSGSLFASSGEGWTGIPDAAFPNAAASNGTGSKVFRLRSKRTDFRDVDAALKLNLVGFVAGEDAAPQDGVSLVLREAADGSAYYVTLGRRDGSLALRKKVLTPAGFAWTNLDAAALAVPLGVSRSLRASARDNPDGSVTLALALDGLEVLRSTDAGTGGAPLVRAGRVGLYSSNAEFRFDDLTAAGLGETGQPAPASPAGFAFLNMYVFPNPAKGGKATLRAQLGRADDVSVNVYDVAGRLVHSGGFGAPFVLDDSKGAGPQLTYEHVWNTSGVGSGVYHCVVTARRAGFSAIKRSERVAVVR